MGSADSCMDQTSDKPDSNVEEKIDTDPPFKFKKYDPAMLMKAISGTWTGDKGQDTIFVTDPNKIKTADSWKDGFVTTYKEIYEYYPITPSILNPKTNSKSHPGGDNKGAERLYALRYVQTVTSTNDDKKFPNNPFKAGQPIHVETGFLLFCYTGINEELLTLTRVVRSSAIPRAISILSHCETKDVTDTLKASNQGALKGEVTFTLIADSTAKAVDDVEWVVANGTLVNKIGKITSYSQECHFSINTETKQNTFYYNQITPLTFKGKPTIHNNSNTLSKVAM
eukprot:190968_1